MAGDIPIKLHPEQLKDEHERIRQNLVRLKEQPPANRLQARLLRRFMPISRPVHKHDMQPGNNKRGVIRLFALAKHVLQMLYGVAGVYDRA
jgi:hypothetical protein